LNRTDLIAAVAAAEAMPEAQVNRVIDEFLERLADALARGDAISFRNFGRFEPRDRAAARRINPKTGVEINVPARRSAGFAPAPGLKRRMNQEGRGQ
jgi:DNA-binding protein HU-beta